MTTIDCMIVSVIKTTLETCSWENCNDICREYLLNVSLYCPIPFHNHVYVQLWQTLIEQCFQPEPTEIIAMSH